ncbi:MAG: DegV family protein [Oscillospiraceae bacterium]
MSIRIITDSASDIVEHSRADLTVLPLTITFGDESYRDGVDLTHREFYEHLIEYEELPTTSQIPPYDFETAFKAARAAGETVIVLCLSSKLSGTCQSALIAREGYEDMVYVIDSETVCVGQRILVDYALRLVDRGLDAEAIVAELERARKKVCLIALLDTLEYLVRGGRMPRTAGMIGGVLSIKPVVSLNGGQVVVLGKARGSRNGNNLLSEKIREAGGVDFSMPYTLGYTGLDDGLLQKYITDSENLWKGGAESLPVHSVGGTIGTHVGPGAIAVAFFHK